MDYFDAARELLWGNHTLWLAILLLPFYYLMTRDLSKKKKNAKRAETTEDQQPKGQ